MKDLRFEYNFLFADRPAKTFTVELDAKTLACKQQQDQPPPDWARLEYMRCPNCCLDPANNPYCPLALNLVPIVYWCADLVSYDEIEIQINSEAREVRVKTALQRGLSSLLGLLMSTSDCPEMKFLRPMARFHLPVATQEETIFRSVSMFLLTEYLQQQADQQDVSFSLQKLKQRYQQIETINRAIVLRLRSAIRRDAAVNAVFLLDVLSKFITHSIDDSLDQIRYLAEAAS